MRVCRMRQQLKENARELELLAECRGDVFFQLFVSKLKSVGVQIVTPQAVTYDLPTGLFSEVIASTNRLFHHTRQLTLLLSLANTWLARKPWMDFTRPLAQNCSTPQLLRCPTWNPAASSISSTTWQRCCAKLRGGARQTAKRASYSKQSGSRQTRGRKCEHDAKGRGSTHATGPKHVS